MAYINTYCEIDLSDASTSDLIDSLYGRYLSQESKDELFEVIGGIDREKLKFFSRVMHMYSVAELQQKLGEEYEPTKPCKEQLTLNF